MSIADVIIRWALPAALLVVGGGVGLVTVLLASATREYRKQRDVDGQA